MAIESIKDPGKGSQVWAAHLISDPRWQHGKQPAARQGQAKDAEQPPIPAQEEKPPAHQVEPPGRAAQDLDQQERAQVQRMRQHEQEVRRQEQARVLAAGRHVRGGPVYSYQNGPDGRRYVVAGKVNLDTSEVPSDPKATLSKAQRIERAATAPADPSARDQRVAAKAKQMEAKARRQLAEQQRRAEERRAEQAYFQQPEGPLLPGPSSGLKVLV